jgi:hypothetical protein
MNNKRNLFNFLFAGMVLFSILFQSFHSYEHILEQIQKKVCFHESNENKADLTHAHIGYENCLVCHYAFSPYEFANSFCAILIISEDFIDADFNFYQKVSLLYKGSLFALRAPPSFF